MRLADAPTIVPLPPRQGPKILAEHKKRESAHHSGMSPSAPPKVGAISLISVIMVATNGMLSPLI